MPLRGRPCCTPARPSSLETLGVVEDIVTKGQDLRGMQLFRDGVFARAGCFWPAMPEGESELLTIDHLLTDGTDSTANQAFLGIASSAGSGSGATPLPPLGGGGVIVIPRSSPRSSPGHPPVIPRSSPGHPPVIPRSSPGHPPVIPRSSSSGSLRPIRSCRPMIRTIPSIRSADRIANFWTEPWTQPSRTWSRSRSGGIALSRSAPRG